MIYGLYYIKGDSIILKENMKELLLFNLECKEFNFAHYFIVV